MRHGSTSDTQSRSGSGRPSSALWAPIEIIEAQFADRGHDIEAGPTCHRGGPPQISFPPWGAASSAPLFRNPEGSRPR